MLMPNPRAAGRPSSRLFVLPLLLMPLAAQAPASLTFADVGKPLVWQGRTPTARWAADGKSVECELDGKTVWLDPATGATREPEAAAAAKAGAPAAPFVMIHADDLWLDVREPVAAGDGRRRSPRPPRPDQPSDRATRLTEDGASNGKKIEAHLSRDGTQVAFVRGNNLCVLDVGTKQVFEVTKDGGPERFHGALDWVYQEEVYGRGDFRGHWWSPDGQRLAFLSLDEAPVRDFTIVDHVPEGFLDQERVVHTEVTNYPKAGDANPFASVAIVRPADRSTVAVDLSAFPPDVLVVRVDWTPDGQHLLLTLQDRIQTWAELCAVDVATGKPARWIREESTTWVNRPDPLRWLADGTFLWLSERTGYQHVYHYAPGGTLLGTITAGEWQVRSLVRVDEAGRRLWFEGTRDGAPGKHLYRIGFDGKGMVCLTPGAGTHDAELDADGSFLIDRHSAMDARPAVCVRDGETGNVVKELGSAGEGEAAVKFGLVARQRLSIPARDGYPLDACLMLPTGAAAGTKRPVFLPTYSGPDAPSVRDAWSVSTYHQLLCQQGFVVLQVNVRSASGRGQAHTGTCYRQLGVQELKDLEDAVDFVCAQHGGDPQRVAIAGWSYGGFMSAYALTHSKKFALGLAGAGVHDWRLYDTIYTERYMRTPQENAAGYDRSSVIKAAKDLHGHLVLLHGSMDDNVHLQNTMQLLYELQRANVQDFELMVYPRSRHGLDPRLNRHSQELQWRRLQQLLQPDLRW